MTVCGISFAFMISYGELTRHDYVGTVVTDHDLWPVILVTYFLKYLCLNQLLIMIEVSEMTTIIEQKAYINTPENRLSCNETRDGSSPANNALDKCIQMTRPYSVSLAPWRYAQIFKNMTIRL